MCPKWKPGVALMTIFSSFSSFFFSLLPLFLAYEIPSPYIKKD
jgi:hypothetical protein